MEPYSPEQDNEGQSDENVLGPNDPEPVVIAPHHFALLWLATLGLYSIWWQYKCWKYIKEREKLDLMPAVRAILFLFFGIELLNRIANYCREYNHKVSYNSIAVWLSVIIINLLSRLPEPYLWLAITGFIPMLLPVMELNFYFTGNKNGYKEDRLNSRQTMLLIIGGAFWALVISSLIMNHGSIMQP